MSNEGNDVRFTLTVITNKERTKVLFAIVNNDLADILLSFLTLPLGMILRLLQKHYGDGAPSIGCLKTLYKGLENLDTSHFSTETAKLMLLQPRSSFEEEYQSLKLDLYDTPKTIFFACQRKGCSSSNLSMYHATETCSCGYPMNREIFSAEPFHNKRKSQRAGNVFTIETMKYLISDDLQMLPNETASVMKTMKDLCLDETDQFSFTIGFNEIMALLKGSLISKTPLTDLILGKGPMQNTTQIKREPICLPPDEIKAGSISSSKKMKVKAIVQRCTNKLLYVEAMEDFIDFMFSFLIIPLGQVERLLGGHTSFTSISNLYRSLANLNYFKTPAILERLINPELPSKYLSVNQILLLIEQTTPVLYHNHPLEKYKEYMKFSKEPLRKIYEATIKDPKGEDTTYINGPSLFMISDDLTVTPFCILSSLSKLKELNVSLSDVEQVELEIGLDEGLSILKASLTSTSTSALTDSINPILNKQRKQKC